MAVIVGVTPVGIVVGVVGIDGGVVSIVEPLLVITTLERGDLR